MAAHPAARRTLVFSRVGAVVISLYWAFLCNLTLELLQTGGNFDRLFSHTLGDALWLTLLSSCLIWCAVLFLWAASGRIWVSMAITSSVAVVLGYANHTKLALRLEPLYPGDFAFASNTGFLTQMVGLGTVVAVLGFVALIVFVIAFSARMLRRRFPRTSRAEEPRMWWLSLGTRLAVTALTLGTLVYATQFNAPDNKVRAAFEAGNAQWAFWYQKVNYLRNGFVGGMLYNLDVPAMTKPEGYSRSTMERLARRYSSAAQEREATRTRNSDDVNIVIVLNEAFSDPSLLDGIKYAEDPIPFTRELMSRSMSGQMLAQLFGGGTANMEFEVLTSMSLSQFTPQMQTPYQMLIPKYAEFPSAVGRSKTDGRSPIAIHPYMTSMYKRETVYPILGFDDFIGEDDMPDAKKIEDSEFISDASAFDEVMEQIERRDPPLLINLVTMQNHYPMKDLYKDPLGVSGLKGETRHQAEGYGRGLQYTDRAIKAFISQLKESDERTAVVFYGDHQPAIWPKGVRKQNDNLAMRKTPFFIWANFPLAERDLPGTTSPIYFLPLLHEAMGAPLPPYYVLLLDLYAAIPAMEQHVYLDDTGEVRERHELPADARQLLKDYRMVQYDLSVGERYSQADMFYEHSDS